ncbi:DUF2304 domain-containing protein [Salinibacterium sp. GXW1014]|uniref:DUF2304 domain-containing protein n=1 Tax=Salinibacterium sp. GXW1014 TaxID=3377838 RepID=UPI00383A7A49
MQIFFQITAAAVIVIAAVFTLRGGGDRHQAIRRVALMLFILAAASSVFVPGIWTWMAQLVGVGRGADLLLYLLVLTFLGFVATTYRHFRSLETRVTLLARELALSQSPPPHDAGASTESPGSEPRQ